MPELRSYSKKDLPRDLAVQVASYVRIQWPFLLKREPPLWDATPYPADGTHFVLFDGDVLIGHALAHQKRLTHAGESWKVGALSSVFTYPTHRGAGHGEAIVAAATEFLRQSGIDFALLFCGERVKNLYLRTGWEHWPTPDISFGDAGNPKLFHVDNPGGFVMGMDVSGRARAMREQREGSPLYVGTNTW